MKKIFLIVFLFFSSSLWADAIQNYDALIRAELAVEEKHSEEAESLNQLTISPVWDFWKKTLLARAKLIKNQPEEALALLKDLPPEPLTPLNKHQDFYRRLYKNALETGAEACRQTPGASCDSWKNRLLALFPDLENQKLIVTELPINEKVDRLHILFTKSLFESIPGFISADEISNSNLSKEKKCQGLLDLGLSYKKLRKREEAAQSLGLAIPVCEGKTLARVFYWKGYLEKALNHHDDAIATFKQLSQLKEADQYRDDAYQELYELYSAQNDTQNSDEALKKLKELPEGDCKETQLWDEAYAAYLKNDYEKATQALDQIMSSRFLGNEAQPQALYWKARIAEILSKKKLGGNSSSLYRQVISSYPFSFYALLAQARLGKAAKLPSFKQLKFSSSADSASEAILVVDYLNKKGDHESAQNLLDYLTYVDPTFTQKNRALIAERWIQSADYNQALQSASEYFDISVLSIDLKTSDSMTSALYPLAYFKDVKTAAKSTGLPEGLILGIMREESLFVSDVRSHAGAVGLMQLMPQTAHQHSKKSGIALPKGGLVMPQVNIRLGSSFLKKLVDLFGGQVALAVMSYNAGPGNISKWLRAQGDIPMDEFIEAIPFSETRGYVKRVLRSARIYGYLLNNPKLTKSFLSVLPPKL